MLIVSCLHQRRGIKSERRSMLVYMLFEAWSLDGVLDGGDEVRKSHRRRLGTLEPSDLKENMCFLF